MNKWEEFQRRGLRKREAQITQGLTGKVKGVDAIPRTMGRHSGVLNVRER